MNNTMTDKVRKMLTKALVQKYIQCPMTGKILDVRTVKCLVDADGDPMYPLSPEAYAGVLKGREAIEDNLNARGLFFPND